MLFDLIDDPGETRNLVRDQPQLAEGDAEATSRVESVMRGEPARR